MLKGSRYEQCCTMFMPLNVALGGKPTNVGAFLTEVRLQGDREQWGAGYVGRTGVFRVLPNHWCMAC